MSGQITRSRSRKPGASPLNPGLPNTLRRAKGGRVQKSRAREAKVQASSLEWSQLPQQEELSGPPATATKDQHPVDVTSSSAASSQPVALQGETAPVKDSLNGTTIEKATATETEPTTASVEDHLTTEGDTSIQQDVSGSSGSTKRVNTSDGNTEQKGPKKPRLYEPTSEGQCNDQDAAQQEAPVLDPCAILEAGLARWKDLAAGSVNSVQDAVMQNTQLQDDTVFRAVAAITEAISGLERGVQFSVLEPATIENVRRGVHSTQPATRPGHEVLIPWIPGDGHSSLYIVRREGVSNNFTIGHFDSISGTITARGGLDRLY